MNTPPTATQPRTDCFTAAAVASVFGDPVQEKLKLSGDGGGVFDLDSRGGVTLTVTRVTTAGPPAAGVADALAGRGAGKGPQGPRDGAAQISYP